MALLYLSQHFSDDIDTQRKGIVVIYFPTSSFDSMAINDPEARQDLRSIFASVALRTTAIHVCLPDSPLYRFIGVIFKVVFPVDLAVRIRIHTGKSGIPYLGQPYCIPCSDPCSNTLYKRLVSDECTLLVAVRLVHEQGLSPSVSTDSWGTASPEINSPLRVPNSSRHRII
jgi:hypothetical protein